MKAGKWLWAVVPLSLLTGCIQSHRREVVYTPEPVLPPTSSRPEVRVYSTPTTPQAPVVTTTPAPATPAPAPPAAAPGDVAVATGISQLLKGDPNLASVSSNVEATVDNNVVTLRGTVPTEHDRDEIVQRVSQLPGVLHVNDQLGIDLR